MLDEACNQEVECHSLNDQKSFKKCFECWEVQFLFNFDDLYGLLWRSSFHRNITFCCHKDNGNGRYKKTDNLPLNSEKNANGGWRWPLSLLYHFQLNILRKRWLCYKWCFQSLRLFELKKHLWWTIIWNIVTNSILWLHC